MTTTGDEAPTAMRFSEALRSATWQVHEHAASASAVQRLFNGDLPLAGYIDLTAQLWFIYDVLEAAADTMSDDPCGGTFVFPELRRGAALVADLRALLGDEWPGQITMLDPTRAYCERMRKVCFTDPAAFVAHHYTRYLGDLSGGQVLAAAARRAYGFVDSVGTRFYEFDEIASHAAFKQRYRGLLDGAPWLEKQRETVLDEVMRAYEYNTQVLAAVGGVDG